MKKKPNLSLIGHEPHRDRDSVEHAKGLTVTGLKIAPSLTLPLDAITETFAILARRGSGKTYTAAVLAEEMIGAGHPVVIIDPLGVWWGLRSSADGKKDGLPVVIFGGDHADVPLTEHSGAIVADVVVAERISAIIDLSLLNKAASRRFMTKFIETLYHRNRDPLHVFVDEADMFAPQRMAPEGAALLGAMEDLVRRGRVRGLGTTLITQRPAVLNKDVLTQASVLVAMRMSGPRDVAAIDEWVRLHADEDEARTLKSSLPSLPVGTAWFWSPGWLGSLQKVKVRTRKTFDSSATPKVGEIRIIPKQLAAIDLDALGEKITATLEEVKTNDPKVLKSRIVGLERELANATAKSRQPAAAAEVVIETVTEFKDVPAIDPKVLASFEMLSKKATKLMEDSAMLVEVLARVEDIATDLNQQASLLKQQAGVAPASTASKTAPTGRYSAQPTVRTERPVRQPAAYTATPTRTSRPAGEQVETGDVYLKAGARRILETFARQYPERLTKSQLGMLAKFKITGGTFGQYWSQIKRLGFLDDNGVDFTLTAEGFDYIGMEPGNPLTTEEVLDRWRSVLKLGARRMLDVVVDTYPESLNKDSLGAAIEMEPSGGTFGQYLGTLRRNGLITVESGEIRASDTLFREA